LQFSAPVSDVRRLIAYRKDGLGWRQVEAKPNELPEINTVVDVDGFDGLDTHCNGGLLSVCTVLEADPNGLQSLTRVSLLKE
jgi:catechol 2,3-dioxygenase-like lactoylglutathione lyase family enzyme